MYCKNCGNESIDGAMFCAYCGKSIREAPLISERFAYDGSAINNMDEYVIKSKLYERFRSDRAWVFHSVIIGIVGVIICVSCLSSAIPALSNPVAFLLYADKHQFLPSTGFLFGILCGMISLYQFISLYAKSNSYIVLTETGVYGRGVGRLNLYNESFTVPYPLITSVRMIKGKMYLESGGKKYKIRVKDVADAAEKILRTAMYEAKKV